MSLAKVTCLDCGGYGLYNHAGAEAIVACELCLSRNIVKTTA